MQIKIFHKDDIHNKLNTRSLYEENFDIGDNDFINYYYDTIIKRNEVAALLDENQVISMVHLNPYSYSVFDKVFNVHYLVAIATKKEYRGKGHMTMLLNAAIDYLKEMHEPFCYLVPENDNIEKFYNRFGFKSVCRFTLDKFSKEEFDIYPIKTKEYDDLMIEEDKFLALETDEYRENLSRKNVLIKLLSNDCGFDLEKLKCSKIYICQEV